MIFTTLQIKLFKIYDTEFLLESIYNFLDLISYMQKDHKLKYNLSIEIFIDQKCSLSNSWSIQSFIYFELS